MRFSVRRRLQNALFRRVRFSSPGQTSTHLTQKRILDSTPHAKAHSGGSEDPRVHLSVRTSYRMCFYVTHKGCRRSHNALFRRVRFSSPGQTRRRLTQKRILECVGTQECTQIGKNDFSVSFWVICVHYCAASGCRMRFSVTYRLQNALFRDIPAAECTFP